MPECCKRIKERMKLTPRLALLTLSLGVLSACSTETRVAPVIDRPAPTASSFRPRPQPAPAPAADDNKPDARGTYTVRRGDTLLRIALDHGQNYRDLVAWNNLSDPDDIKVGQVLKVAPLERSAAAVVTSPISMPGAEKATLTPYGVTPPPGTDVPEVDIAVDPLEGTNLCATGAAGSITVLAASEAGGLLHAPDCYMEKIIVGPSCKDAVNLDAPVKQNLHNIAKRLERSVQDLVIVVLDRPRHKQLIDDIRMAGARIRLISDGDLSAGIAAAVIGTGVHAVMGSGGAPEGVITAAALRCLNGFMLGRLVINKPELEERIASMGIRDKNRVYRAEDLAPGNQIIFAATGVTDGALLKGVRFFGEGTRTSSIVLTLRTGKVRFIESIHLAKQSDVKVRFA